MSRRPFGFDFRFVWNDSMNPIWAEDTDDACAIAGELIVEHLMVTGVTRDDVIDLGLPAIGHITAAAAQSTGDDSHS